MKKLGFGCMRLPMIGGAEGQVDQAQFNQMVDRFLAEGFTYFDTAHVYINGQSELALREGLVKRYPRDAYILTDKLSGSQFQSEAEILPFFQRQLEATGVTYFDYYLMHSQSAGTYKKFTDCNAFSVVAQLKAEGKIRHMGISFHDKAAVLEQILTEHPEIEVVQIQFNYRDYDDPSIESGAVYEVCRKFNKPILIMEPVKGGKLAQLPPSAERVLSDLNGGSPASYAIRYAASFDGVLTVLSGMSDLAQMEDNLSYMKDFKPLTPAEHDALTRVCEILKGQNTIPCTACRYCVAGCPKQIPIPSLFACLNAKRTYQDWSSDYYYEVNAADHGKPSDCIHCHRCEQICPQHLNIPQLLEEVSAAFESAPN